MTINVPVPRLTVALTFDHDALSDGIRRGDPPVKLSHGEFGPRIGAPRILALLAARGIASTWFVPGHTLESFPESTAAIVEGGHELASHGWFHEDFAELSVDEQRDVLSRSFEALTRARGGTPPTGWRAPYWSLGPRTLELVESAGFRYDSSLMADDYSLYKVRFGDRHSLVEGTTWAVNAASSRCRSTGRWTTGHTSSPHRSAAVTASPPRRRCWRSGPPSFATRTTTRPAGCSW
jgi:peptidoglycan/xylan/chitin deacetylase (PgdA/CDA1 family)